MESSSTIGMLLLLMGAVCGGCFGLPSKFAGKDTPWETLWGPFFLFVTVLIPTTIFPLIAKGLFATCATVGLAALMPVLIFGFLWGLGSMALGMSFAFIGLSLAYAINYGAQIACGGVGPMMIHSRDQAGTPHGLVILAGVAVCIVGVALCGRAALLRESSQKTEVATTAGQPNMTKGLVLAFLSGALCACYSIAFSYGGQVMDVSMKQFGNEGWRAAFVVSALILWGGALSACGACVVKLCKNKTWGSFAKPGIGRVLMVALAMALLHDGAILFFGVGASMLGPLGIAVGYAVFMSFAIMVGNFNGFVTREWKGASTRSVAWLAAGILVLVVGVSTLARGNYMQGQQAKPATEAVTEGKQPSSEVAGAEALPR